jgi:hypothetical protein
MVASPARVTVTRTATKEAEPRAGCTEEGSPAAAMALVVRPPPGVFTLVSAWYVVVYLLFVTYQYGLSVRRLLRSRLILQCSPGCACCFEGEPGNTVSCCTMINVMYR